MRKCEEQIPSCPRMFLIGAIKKDYWKPSAFPALCFTDETVCPETTHLRSHWFPKRELFSQSPLPRFPLTASPGGRKQLGTSCSCESFVVPRGEPALATGEHRGSGIPSRAQAHFIRMPDDADRKTYLRENSNAALTEHRPKRREN